MNGEDDELGNMDLSVDASAACAETSLSLDSLLESSLSSVYPPTEAATDDSFYFYMDGDFLPLGPSLGQPEKNSCENFPMCTSSNWLSAAAGYVSNSNDVSDSIGGAGATSQTSPFSSRQVGPSMTAITLHSTPISTPVKPLFHPEISPAERNGIYLSLDSTGFSESSLALNLNSTFNSFDESTSSSLDLFLQEPTALVNASKKNIVEVVQPECCKQFCLLHLTASETSSTLEHFKIQEYY